ncbi:hypothetical protein BTO32_15335 [Marinobacter lutaoensis]|uniref:Uncharacterized protein n=1 Tax=Marinobacter lutaoensis TaxID=135739 RepID=A0A1V2DPH9_9GAMM|nr:hypothetical protein [Marinobacter lutaoensis]ONF42578.1 hypothetical protein BTO32_15335 [Marinobacter lutaoensis]
MSRDFKIILLLAVAPLLAFWGWQIGFIGSQLALGGAPDQFALLPGHWGWHLASLVLVAIKFVVAIALQPLIWVQEFLNNDAGKHRN